MKFRLGRLFFSFEPNRAIIGCLPVGAVCDCENVRRNFDALLALIQLDDLLGVDGQPLVRVHHHTEEARVCLKTRRRNCQMADILLSIQSNEEKVSGRHRHSISCQRYDQAKYIVVHIHITQNPLFTTPIRAHVTIDQETQFRA